MQLRLSHKVFILVLVLLALEMLFIGCLGWLLHQSELETQREAKARDIVMNAQLLLTDIYRVAMTATSSVYMPEEGESFEGNIAEVERRFQRELELVKDDPKALDEVSRLDRQMRPGIQILREMRIAALDAPFDKRAKTAFYAGRTKTAAMSFPLVQNLREFVEYEQKKQVIDPEAGARQREQVKQVLIAGVVLNLILALCASAYLTRGITRRIERLRENTLRLGLGQPLRAAEPGSDDIAHLDSFLHSTAAALAEASRRETLVIENAVDVICSLDKTGKFTNVNVAANKVFGYSPEELIGSHLNTIVVEEDRESTNQKIQNAAEGVGDRQIEFENRVARKDGSFVDILWSAQWSRVERTLFCVAHDITERKEVETMKKELVGIVSHELKTPLTSVQGFLTLLSENIYGALTEQGLQRVRVAERNVEHLIKLVSDLLAVEKLESGRAELTLSVVSMSALCQRAHENVSQFAADHDVTIELPQTDAEIEADEDRLTQVVINLLSNAVKYSPPKGLVRVSVQKSTDWLEMRVDDHGPGIPLSAQKRIFERFQQVNSSADERKGGSGLGLAICRSIVEQHGGLIGVDSEEGKGSSFWLRLPAVSAVTAGKSKA